MKKIIIYTKTGTMYETTTGELTYENGYIRFTGNAVLLAHPSAQSGTFTIPFENIDLIFQPLAS